MKRSKPHPSGYVRAGEELFSGKPHGLNDEGCASDEYRTLSDGFGSDSDSKGV